jgi:hypothetical protein
MANVIAYHSYGRNRRYHLELTYSVLSAVNFLKHQPADIRIVLVCDSHNQRPDLPVENLVISDKTMHEWQMNGTYNHAMQAYSPHHILELYQSPTVLVDSDTIFKKHPKFLFERIGPGRSLLNAREGLLCELPEWASLKDQISHVDGIVDGVQIVPETVMYNAGVIGLHPADIDAMSKIKSMTSAIRQVSDIFTAVQLAASIVLTRDTQVSTCEDVLEHYWGGPRAYYHYQINKMFPEILRNEPIPALSGTLPALQGLPKTPIVHRLAAAAMRLQRRAPPEYAFAYQAYHTANQLRNSDPELANVWALAGVDMLIWGMPFRTMSWVVKDFNLYEPSRIADQHWMRSEVRDRWLRYWHGDLGPRAEGP